MAIVVTGEHDNYIIQPRPLLDMEQLARAPDAETKVSGRDLALLDTGHVTYYACTNHSTGNYYFLVIANTIADNPVIDDLSAILEKLRDLVSYHNQVYRESGRILPKPEGLGFDHLFPIVIDQFTCSEQGNRRVLVLDYSFADLGQAIVACQLPEQDVRVDLRTSSWILARLLKLIGFINLHQMTIPVSLESILIVRKTHRLMWLDWTPLVVHDDKLSTPLKCLGLKQAASAVLSLIGANFVSQDWRYEFFSADEQQCEGEKKYFQLLIKLYAGGYDNAVATHHALNDVFYEIWPTGFYPFTAYAYKNNRTLVDEQNLL